MGEVIKKERLDDMYYNERKKGTSLENHYSKSSKNSREKMNYPMPNCW